MENATMPIPDKKRLNDHLVTAGQAVVDLVPGVGGAANRVIDSIIKTPLNRRRDEWLNALEARLEELEQLGLIDRQRLDKAEKFISAFVQASSAAIKTDEPSKIEALRNAVLNVAVTGDDSEIESEVFLSMIDRFSALHIKVLSLLANSDIRQDRRIELIVERIAEKVLELDPRIGATQELLELVVDDLTRAGFLKWSRHGGVEQLDRIPKQVTPLGTRFYKFITDPAPQ